MILRNRQCSALTDGEGRRLFNLRPDAVIRASAAPLVLDTKWKRLTPNEPSCEFKLGGAQPDIYQMLAYARAYSARRLVLLYRCTKAWANRMGKAACRRSREPVTA